MSWCWPMQRPSTRARGSEYPAVVIPLTTQHYTMLQRNLGYTGLTRGKRLVALVGQRKALAQGRPSEATVVKATGRADCRWETEHGGFSCTNPAPDRRR